MLIAVILLAPSVSYAWDDCPLGVTNCTYPGECSKYVDTNNDGICDHSQPAPISTDIDSTAINTQTSDNQTNSTVLNDENNGNDENQKQSYYLLPITLILTAFYVVSHILFKRGKIKLRVHKKLWNWIITASFLVTGITGLELTIFINFGIHSSLNGAITFWHAVASIIMVVTTFFHVHMYWKPFKKSFKLVRSSKGSKREKVEKLSLSK